MLDRIMNRLRLYSGILCLLLIASLVSRLNAQDASDWNRILPNSGPKPVKILISGKRVSYYPLDKDGELAVTVQGPTTLRVLSRVDFGQDPRGDRKYGLTSTSDNGKKEEFLESATVSSATLAKDKENRVGAGRSIFIEVPAGKHTYKLHLAPKMDAKTYLRFYVPSTDLASQSEHVIFTPHRATTPVILVVKELETTYYRAGQADTVGVSLIGPTILQVSARLEFDSTMVTAQKFRLRVLEDGLEKQTFSLRAVPSQVADYLDDSDKIPGQAAKIYVAVPRGKHEYAFEVLDGGRAALLRFSIPRKDLTNNL